MRSIVFLPLMAWCSLLCPFVWGQSPVFFVDVENASGVENGRSWETAFSTIQPAIDAAGRVGGGEVWVAEGTYGERRSLPLGSLTLKPGVSLYGGFSGTETEREARDPLARETVIDGSASRDGEPAVHVVQTVDGTLLDGFTIQGGGGLSSNPSVGGRSGAGVLVLEGLARIQSCYIVGNDSRGSHSLTDTG